MHGRISISFLAGLAMAQPVFSHHNFAAHYRTEETIEISGVVTEFRFVNPHVRVYIEARDESGTVEMWMAEGDASVSLRRSGWTADQLKPGDRVEVVGSPSRSGANMLGWETITLNGEIIQGGSDRVDERLRILDRDLAEFRRQRGR